ncbi:MAG: phage major capsid protein [Chloroflexota bacterium]|nr:phage major capsid protein [Chloroflexota bacterium]MDQ5864968.1 phage major capsid protein [Chloroflexota bacterium]
MPLTLAEATKLSQDMLLKGVVETIIAESAVLRYLPFVQVVGNSLRYNQEATAGTVDFYEVGDTWTESAMTVTEVSTKLAILGGDADVDAFLQQTYSDPNDLRALVVSAKSKSLANKFSDTFFNGNSATNAKQFDGVKKLAAGTRTMNKGANGAPLELDHLDELIDMIKPGAPHVLFTSKRTRRYLSALRRASGNVLETSTDMFGRRVLSYDGIPVEVDDHIPDNETLGTSTDCSSIYAVQFGFQTGLCGLENGGIMVQPLGALETKDAWRTRIKWYCGLALFRKTALARLEGVRT